MDTSEGIDRISNLPDEIITHILSFLLTKDSVCTRILSKRWKNLFTVVPVLDFSNLLVQDPITRGPFLEFVDFVFNSYNADRMNKFIYCLASSSPLEPGESRLISWIEDSLNRGVRELCLTEDISEDFDGPELLPQMLPKNILNNNNLTVLKLHGLFDLDVQDNMRLPNLKILDLKHLTFCGDESVHRLFQSCPVLEDLSLFNCGPAVPGVCDICVPTLLRLKLIMVGAHMNEFVLEVPNLTYLELYDWQRFTIKGALKCLIDANISFAMVTRDLFEASSKLVSLVSHVETLQICAYTLDAYKTFGQLLPTLPNVTTLAMTFYGKRNFDLDMALFENLLDRTPCLDRLVLDDHVRDMHGPFNTLDLEHVPICVSMNLKVIEFKSFRMMNYELNLVEYFLKTAPNLNKLHIQTKLSLKDQLQFSKEVLAFSRCSRTCQVILDSVEAEE